MANAHDVQRLLDWEEERPVSVHWCRALRQVHARVVGRHVLAPVDLSQPGLQVIDVNCHTGEYSLHQDMFPILATLVHEALGTWLLDVNDAAPAPHWYYGGYPEDLLLSQRHFPGNIRLTEARLANYWPTHAHNHFDLVNMAITIPDAAFEGLEPQQLVSRQAALVKPGGYLQLTEMVYTDVAGQAMTLVSDLRAAHRVTSSIACGQILEGDIAESMETWMQEAGLEDIGSQDAMVPMGIDVGDEDLATVLARGWNYYVAKEISGLIMLQRWRNRYPGAVPALPPLPVRMNQLPFVRGLVEELLLTEGGSIRFVTVWGRKPLLTGS